jgi:NAD(P)-dependent dehydrogenase (short-subunit alcohol dehydrogenase family)
MNIELKGRKAIVTGSTAGIGRATAEGLARAGASVVINGRGEARIDEAVRQMRRAFPGSDISGIAADLATAEGAEALIAQAPDADILVNNVGTAHIRSYSGVEDIANIPDEDWLGLFQLNVMSGVRVTRHYLPRMVAKGWGRVVFVSSESAVNIPKEMLDYGMTKTAQLAVSRGLAETVAGTGVTVNAVLPSIIDTPANRADMPDADFGRWVAPSELAAVILFLASPEAGAITGALLPVTGGV